jgi:hypothetical protein
MQLDWRTTGPADLFEQLTSPPISMQSDSWHPATIPFTTCNVPTADCAMICDQHHMAQCPSLTHGGRKRQCLCSVTKNVQTAGSHSLTLSATSTSRAPVA